MVNTKFGVETVIDIQGFWPHEIWTLLTRSTDLASEFSRRNVWIAGLVLDGVKISESVELTSVLVISNADDRGLVNGGSQFPKIVSFKTHSEFREEVGVNGDGGGEPGDCFQLIRPP